MEKNIYFVIKIKSLSYITRKVKVTFSAKKKLEYPKLMVEGGYSNIQVEKISGAGKSVVSRSKQQYR
ncbi:hypothetical protein [Arsenophonus endosymbiont of Bemisia tabaci]|uniref:hypothetical protein n=1 Tax=Arsenophonus endosymbiont of Bemisia tabaci TaxID=536059 RepID=UPI0015F678F6|nr:hypothetical protein [Arsenophonus endosymbiont of Bemisia tabaci]